jgi:hypothetical protein
MWLLLQLLLVALSASVGWFIRTFFERTFIDIYQKQRKGLDLTSELDSKIYEIRCKLVDHAAHFQTFTPDRLQELRKQLWELECTKKVKKEVADFLK